MKVQITYELTSDVTAPNGTHTAKEALYKNLYTPEGRISKSWDIGNYSEITKYATNDGYIDMDSHPGNLDIAKYEAARKAYQEAYAVWEQNKTDANALKVQLAETRLLMAREDDSWRVGIILTNHGNNRKLSGNVWEAINDEVKSSLDLQSEYGERFVEWNNNPNLALGGIKVELVELLKDDDTEKGSNQVVRGVTTTKGDGSYTFESYIPGDYTVRFVYGDYDNTDKYSSENKNGVIYSKVTQNTYDDKSKADYLPINGQYYQSTKANPETDTENYWYAEKAYSSDKQNVINVKKPRYSDAYDDVYSRLTQINAKIENAENSTSAVYDYDGNIEVEAVRHTDPIYSYTSTMELEVEYIRPEILGDRANSWYKYEINGVDFGVTPRAYNDVNVSRYISHITLFKEGEEKTPIIDADFDRDGILQNRETAVGAKYVGDTDNGAIISYKDGVIHVNYEQMVQNRAHLELTYTVDVSNDSLYDANNKIYDTIKYIYSSKEKDKPIAVVYYGEKTDELTAFESLGRPTDTLVYHNTITDEGYNKGLAGEDRNLDTTKPATNTRIGGYSLITGLTKDFEGNRDVITSKVTNIVDYPTHPLDFAKKDHNGNDVNANWVDTNYEEFVSARENYKVENGEISLIGTPGEENSLVTKSHILRAKDDSPLYKELKPGEVTTDTIMLQHTLLTVQSDITGDSVNTDLSALDEEYSNMVEITRLQNSAGKIVDIEGYDITGDSLAETSSVHNISDIETELMDRKQDEKVRVSTFNLKDKATELKLTPTLCTGKSQTTVITPPAGLPESENWGSYVIITLLALVVFAGGTILIKKYVLNKVPKA